MNTILKQPKDLSGTGRYGLIFLLIFITGVALRVIKLVRMPLVAPDAVGYVHNAMAIGTEGLRSLFVHGFTGNVSVYPVLIYLVNFVIGDPILSGQLVSLFFGFLLIVVVYLLAKEMMGPRVGLFAAFLTAVHPHLIRYSGEVLKDSMLFFFAIASVFLALWGHERRNYPAIFLAGLLAWAASLVRIYGITIVASISVAIIVSGLIERQRWRTIAQDLLLFAVPAPVVGYLLFVLFVGARNEFIIQSLMSLSLSIKGSFSAVASYRDILLANNPGVDSQYLDVITSYPALSALAEFANVFVTAFNGLLFGLFLVGLYLGRSSLLKRGPSPFVLFCAGVVILIDIFILMTVFFLSKRHVMIAVILLLPWSALALDRIIAWYRERAGRKYRMKSEVFNGIVAVSLAVWVILALAFTSFLDTADTKHYYKRAAAEYIKGLGQPNPLILVQPSDRLIPLYAGGREIVLNDDAALEKTVTEERPDFIVWDTNKGTPPESIKTLSDEGTLVPVKTIKGTKEDSIIIYRMEKN
jgi:4-amino-4-deoxy-L-arabinose transferase-like glycosyltransferase